MKVLYFDCFSGISGDMVLGALLDLGIDQNRFRQELEKLNLPGYELIIEKSVRYGIVLTNVQVVLLKEMGNDSFLDSEIKHAEKNLRNIERLIDTSRLSDRVKHISKEVFLEIAEAEAKVHGCSIYDIHFHEVGAIDSIVDIVGSAICLDLLNIERVYSSAVHDGRGFVQCQHGEIPVPVPAVSQMLVDSNIPLHQENIPTELVTPTGLGIIKTFASYFGIMPQMYIEKVGYGAGKKDIGKLNALRVFVGAIFEHDSYVNDVSILETNLDNTSPEVIGYVFDRLLDEGALDVFYTPIYMKKNRPGTKLSVITPIEKEQQMTKILFTETGTLGVRRTQTQRYIANREIINIDTPYGGIDMKVSNGNEWEKATPEYEDVKEKAMEYGVPFNTVYDAAKHSYNEKTREKK